MPVFTDRDAWDDSWTDGDGTEHRTDERGYHRWRYAGESGEYVDNGDAFTGPRYVDRTGEE